MEDPQPLKPEETCLTRVEPADLYYRSEAKNVLPYDDETDALLNDEELQVTHTGIGIRCLHTLLNMQQIDQGQATSEWVPLTIKELREDRAQSIAIVEALDRAVKGEDEPATIGTEFEGFTFEEMLNEVHKQYDELRAPALAVLETDKRARETAEVALKLYESTIDRQSTNRRPV